MKDDLRAVAEALSTGSTCPHVHRAVFSVSIGPITQLCAACKELVLDVVAASLHVVPHPDGTGWLADMRPMDGPVLGPTGTWQPANHTHSPFCWDSARQVCRRLTGALHELEDDRESLAAFEPFPTRAAALAAERAWVQGRGL